jgi:tripartite-type tricarboxylate transporter receptor subunit TctC
MCRTRAALDVMGGRIGYYFAGMPVGLPLAKSGKARALAVTSKTRFAGAPDIPTVAEQGLPEYEATLWQGFFAPSSVPADLAARIAADIEKVVALPETREKLQGAGVSLFSSNHAEFKRFFPTEVAKWRDVVKKANLKLE